MPDRDLLALLAGRWTPHVLLACMDRPRRFSELGRALPQVSRRMLTYTLRSLETAGLLTRTVHPNRAVTYEATPMAGELRGALTDLAAWAIRHRHLTGR